MSLSDLEELKLSDRIVAYKAILNSCKSEGREPTAEEQVVIEDGKSACSELVEHYKPYLDSLVAAMHSQIRGGTEEQRKEMQQVAAEAALRVARSYSLRGKDGKAFGGVRFAKYCNLTVRKALQVHLGKSSTGFYVTHSAILSSWKWEAVRGELYSQLGRQPTTEEIEAKAGITRDSFKQFPTNNDILHIDDEELTNREPSVNNFVNIVQESTHNTALLISAFKELFNDEIANYMMLYLGLDRMAPRSVEEFAKKANIKISLAHSIATMLEDIMAHPKHRIALRDYLELNR